VRIPASRLSSISRQRQCKNTGGDFSTGKPRAMRQRVNAAAICLGVRGFVSLPIGQALSDDAFDGAFGAEFIVHA
jgi:hypothetical protein